MHEDSASPPIAARQRPRPSFRHHRAPSGPSPALLEHELTARLDTTVKLRFDGDPLDMQARAATFKALVAGGVAVNEALTTAGLLTDD